MLYPGPRNADVAWDEFNPDEYLSGNYRDLRDDDRRLMEIVRDHFSRNCGDGLRGIDVGTGANLYPALTMVPFCESVTLYERSSANLAWLTRQIARGVPSWSTVWSGYWSVLRADPRYAGLRQHPGTALADRAEVTAGDLFDLDDGAARWDLGTMFFVAESITSRLSEFTAAVRGFLGALRVGAPFAMAFMENSAGYVVGGVWFPAVAVDAAVVRRSLDGRATGVTVRRVDMCGSGLRDGYTGMVVACGRSLGRRAPRAG